MLYHVAELDLYLGIVPFAALVLLTFVGRSLDRPLRVFLAAALPLTAWLLLEVGAFASALSPRIQERNLFYVAPLFLIALLAWIERGMPRPPRAAAIAAVLAAALARSASVSPPHRCPRRVGHACVAAALVAPGDRRRAGHDPGRGRRGGRGDRPALLLHLAALRARAAWRSCCSGSRSRRNESSASTTASRRHRSVRSTRASLRRGETGSMPRSAGTPTSPSSSRARTRRITLTLCGRTSSTTAASGRCTTCGSRRWAACPRPT